MRVISLISLVVLPVVMFLAWSVGGEYRFGKGKRGLLLAIPLSIVGIVVGIQWYYLVAQVGILFGLYSCLFYDKGIKMVYGAESEQNPGLGWLIIVVNGALIGLTCIIFAIARLSITTGIIGLLAGILGFIQVVKLSNDFQYSQWRVWWNKHGLQAMPYKNEYGQAGFYINMKDSWYVSEGLMGAILGIVLSVCLLF